MCMDTLLQCSTLMCVMAVGCVCSVCVHSVKVIKVISSIAIYITVVVQLLTLVLKTMCNTSLRQLKKLFLVFP